jgi:hypothetical protein
MKTKDLKLLLFVPSLVFASCKGQTKKESQLPSVTIVQTDTANIPKYKIKVNKQYDDSGHLMRYDSSYSYSYTSPGGKQSIKDDSIFKRIIPAFLIPQCRICFTRIRFSNMIFSTMIIL